MYLEPILPDGESIVRAVNAVVSCMRDECEGDMLVSCDHHLQRNGRGRLRLCVSKDQLVFLLEHGFKQCDIATMLRCSPRTVKRRITDCELDQCLMILDIDDQLLDLIVQDIQKQYSTWEEKSVQGHLSFVGLTVQRWRVLDSLWCTCPSAVKQRF